jgi:hypothetical protein
MSGDIIPWTKEYGDEDQWGKFAGRFVSYNPGFSTPAQHEDTGKKLVLLMSDSIFGGQVWLKIAKNLKDIANLNYIQHPHHAGNIQKWLDIWELNKWMHYNTLINYEGLHGFPPRQSDESHLADTTELVKRYKKVFKNILWVNMTPVPQGFKTGMPCSSKGPNSIEQEVTDEVVKKRNQTLSDIMAKENVCLLDAYSLIKEKQIEYQLHDDLHLTPSGSAALADMVSKAASIELS